jgi:hypothetical protein
MKGLPPSAARRRLWASVNWRNLFKFLCAFELKYTSSSPTGMHNDPRRSLASSLAHCPCTENR